MVPVRLSWLVISLVILSVSTAWIAGSWISGSTVATHRPVSDTSVPGPDAEDGDRAEYAAEDDEHDGDGGPPAEAPPVTRGRLLAEFGVLRAEALYLTALILSWLSVGVPRRPVVSIAH